MTPLQRTSRQLAFFPQRRRSSRRGACSASGNRSITKDIKSFWRSFVGKRIEKILAIGTPPPCAPRQDKKRERWDGSLGARSAGHSYCVAAHTRLPGILSDALTFSSAPEIVPCLAAGAFVAGVLLLLFPPCAWELSLAVPAVRLGDEFRLRLPREDWRRVFIRRGVLSCALTIVSCASVIS